jgi:hypothetical protein
MLKPQNVERLLMRFVNCIFVRLSFELQIKLYKRKNYSFSFVNRKNGHSKVHIKISVNDLMAYFLSLPYSLKFTFMSVCLIICMFISLSLCLSISILIYLSISLCVDLPICQCSVLYFFFQLLHKLSLSS